MAEKIFNTRVQIKRDTSSNWTVNNPVLLAGELVIVDTNSGDVRFKVGNGTSHYTELPFQDESILNKFPDVSDFVTATNTENFNNTASVKTLKDSNKTDIIYPQTKAEAVYTADGQTVDTVLNTKLTTPTGTQGQFLGFVQDNVVGALEGGGGGNFGNKYDGTLGSTSWTNSGERYYAQVAISGMTAESTPIVIPQWTTNQSNEQSSWNNLEGVESFDGYVRFYASAAFATNVNYIMYF